MPSALERLSRCLGNKGDAWLPLLTEMGPPCRQHPLFLGRSSKLTKDLWFAAFPRLFAFVELAQIRREIFCLKEEDEWAWQRGGS